MHDPDAHIDLGAVTLAVDDRGGGDRIPLVLIHGFTGGRIDFADVIGELARDRRVVAWDHRGHSHSTNTGDGGDYTFDALAADALAALDALDLPRVHLLGHSMGGVVAQRIVVEHPEKVASLILMDTLSEPAAIPREWTDRFVQLGRAEGMGAVADAMADLTAGVSVAPDADQPRIASRNHLKLELMDVEAYAALAAELCSFPSLLPHLASVSCPTTVVVGELDRPLRAAADELAATIPGATLVVIEGAAHCPQEERPAEWLAAVLAHLERAEAATPVD